MIVPGGRGLLSGFGSVTADTVTTTGDITADQFVFTNPALGLKYTSENTGISRTGTDQLTVVCNNSNYLLVSPGVVNVGNAAYLQSSGTHYEQGIATVTQFTGNVDNLATPTAARTVRVSADAPRNWTGIVADASGRGFWIVNVGSNTITMIHDLTSTAANRFYCVGAANISLTQYKQVRCWYDTTLSRWLVG